MAKDFSSIRQRKEATLRYLDDYNNGNTAQVTASRKSTLANAAQVNHRSPWEGLASVHRGGGLSVWIFVRLAEKTKEKSGKTSWKSSKTMLLVHGRLEQDESRTCAIEAFPSFNREGHKTGLTDTADVCGDPDDGRRSVSVVNHARDHYQQLQGALWT
uniref:Transposase n=1 Tax=Panagrellus redivivus TaxID=6233 RepID=A0A7E4VEH4_PANRE